jgi:hypothetical protein
MKESSIIFFERKFPSANIRRSGFIRPIQDMDYR